MLSLCFDLIRKRAALCFISVTHHVSAKRPVHHKYKSNVVKIFERGGQTLLSPRSMQSFPRYPFKEAVKNNTTVLHQYLLIWLGYERIPKEMVSHPVRNAGHSTLWWNGEDCCRIKPGCCESWLSSLENWPFSRSKSCVTSRRFSTT